MFRERRNMNHRLAGIVVALVVVLGLLASAQTAPNASAPAGAATGKAADKPSPKSRGAGPDPNIKQDQNQAATNAQETPAPLPKSGQKQRGPTDCWVTAANESPWYVNVYVDGTYRGRFLPGVKELLMLELAARLCTVAPISQTAAITLGDHDLSTVVQTAISPGRCISKYFPAKPR